MRKGLQLLGSAFKNNSIFRKNNKLVSGLTNISVNHLPKFQFSQGDGKYSQETMDKLKKQAQQFYETEVKSKETPIYDLQKQDEWQTVVLDSPIPVVLDCYADWCQPCQKLTPILEQHAAKSQGKWKLVKLNIDKFPQLATALQIQSIPTVYLISNKNAIDGFVGGIDETELNAFFETVKQVAGLSPQEDDVKDKLALASTFIENDTKLNEAKAIIQSLLDNEVYKNKYGGRLISQLSVIAAKEGNKQDALKYLNEIRTKYSEEAKDEEIQQLMKKTEDILEALKKKLSDDPEIDRLKELIEKNPKDPQLIFNLAEYQVKKNLHEDAIDNLFLIIQIDRNWENKKANKLLIDIFSQLGAAHTLTIQGRKRLQKLLY
ncbi:hypothetical protein ABPG74_020659 [Tetrahymena malaccensis]